MGHVSALHNWKYMEGRRISFFILFFQESEIARQRLQDIHKKINIDMVDRIKEGIQGDCVHSSSSSLFKFLALLRYLIVRMSSSPSCFTLIQFYQFTLKETSTTSSSLFKHLAQLRYLIVHMSSSPSCFTLIQFYQFTLKETSTIGFL